MSNPWSYRAIIWIFLHGWILELSLSVPSTAHQWLQFEVLLEGTIKVIPALKCEGWGERFCFKEEQFCLIVLS